VKNADNRFHAHYISARSPQLHRRDIATDRLRQPINVERFSSRGSDAESRGQSEATRARRLPCLATIERSQLGEPRQTALAGGPLSTGCSVSLSPLDRATDFGGLATPRRSTWSRLSFSFFPPLIRFSPAFSSLSPSFSRSTPVHSCSRWLFRAIAATDAAGSRFSLHRASFRGSSIIRNVSER